MTSKSVQQVTQSDMRHDSVSTDIIPSTSEKKAVSFSDLWRRKRVIAWCLVIYLLPINFGYEAASTGNLLAIPTFLKRFGTPLPGGLIEITAHDQQVLNAAFLCGIFIASFAGGFISDIFGRKWTVVLASIICIAGILIQSFANTILQIFGGKFVSSCGFGIGQALAPVYVAEIAPDELRGFCLILVNSTIVIGSWMCSLVAYGTSHIANDWAWRGLLLTQLAPPTLMIILGSLILPESPSWLIIKGKPEKAAVSYRKFNGPDFDTTQAVAIMEAAVQKEKELEKGEASYLDCFRGSNLRRTVIIVLVFTAQQFSGSGFVAGYLPYFFTVAGVANPIGIAQISYSIQLLGNIVSWFLVDRLGRRPLIVYGMIVMTATLLIIGGLGTIKNNMSALNATIAFMSLWGFLYQLTLGAVAYAVGGETPAARVRQKTYSINLMATTASATLVAEVTPLLINPSNANLGAKIAFVFFALSAPLCIYLYFCFPEMKGRSYLELEDMFQNKVPARQFKTYKCNVKIETAEDGEKAVSVVHDEGRV